MTCPKRSIDSGRTVCETLAITCYFNNYGKLTHPNTDSFHSLYTSAMRVREPHTPILHIHTRARIKCVCVCQKRCLKVDVTLINKMLEILNFCTPRSSHLFSNDYFTSNSFKFVNILKFLKVLLHKNVLTSRY